jgi:hypothetical protein
MTNFILKTGKMQKETEQQYFAWLLYCKARSIEDMISAWELIRTGRWQSDLPDGWRGDIKRLGELPAKRNVEVWSSRYRWVERKELKLQQEIEELYKRAQKYQINKKHKIVIIFGRIMDDFLKRVESGKLNIENMTISDFKKIWEMARTELGETLGKHEILLNEEEQRPPTSEEKEFGKAIDEAVKQFYGLRGKAKTKK